MTEASLASSHNMAWHVIKLQMEAFFKYKG
jgi:hypothetical protein